MKPVAATYTLEAATGVRVRDGFAGIAYADGGEQRILDLLLASSDLSTGSAELARAIATWPDEAHLSPARANLLRPFHIGPEHTVLEFGAGCGALTRYLGECGATVHALEGTHLRARCAAARTRDLPNVSVYFDDLSCFEPPALYDVVTLVGVLEYARLFLPGADPVQACLGRARSLLKPGGVLLLAIENQLGLKYFNGCHEDHLGARFTGITDLYGPGTPVTFGRRELGERITRAGFAGVDWYYPFPDYKVPTVIVADRALEVDEFAVGDLLFGESARDHGGSALRSFDESGAWPVLRRNALLGDLANSFMAVARTGSANPADPDPAWLAHKYSATRMAAYATVTTFAHAPDGVTVAKAKLYPQAREPVAPPLALEHRVGPSRYVQGRLFVRSIADTVARTDRLEDIAAAFTPWLSLLLSRAREGADAAVPWSQLTVPGELLDCVPFNLVVDGDGRLVPIDLEFAAAHDVPLPWMVLRGVVHTAGRCFGQRALLDLTCGELLNAVVRQIGLADVTDWTPICALEDRLVLTVLLPWPGRRSEGLMLERLRTPASSTLSAYHRLQRLEEASAARLPLAAELDVARARMTELESRLAETQSARATESQQTLQRVAELSERDAALRAETAGLRATHAAQLEHAATEARNAGDLLRILQAELVNRDDEITQLRRQLETASSTGADARETLAVVGTRMSVIEASLWHRMGVVLGRAWRGTNDALGASGAAMAKSGAAAARSGGAAVARSGAVVTNGALRAAGQTHSALTRPVFALARSIYTRLPFSEDARNRAKDAFYSSVGLLFRNTQNYQMWERIRNAPPPPVATTSGPRPLDKATDAQRARTVSVVIPAYGKPELTRTCIASVRDSGVSVPFEIIVVDDGSPAPLEPALKDETLVRIVRLDRNAGFIEACNRGAAEAQGAYLLFLNNDAELEAGAVDELLSTFDRYPETGVAGAKLVFPDGRLQEAGAYIRRDGSAEMVGLWDDATKPQYNFVREIGYTSGACLMIPRALFTEIGGFDREFAPAYCEDSDLCYRVRATGRCVMYQPRAVAVHRLSASMQDSPIDKPYVIAVNQQKFLERWSDTLQDDDRLRAIAFYLPQYHPIPENDAWWGKGFTEWSNVARARPLFTGHHQPNIPTDLGFYDLRVPQVRSQQAELARGAGLHGFCYYYYWFGGTRLLNGPLDAMVASGAPDFPFCVCWANENWTRRWDGMDSDILIAQRHSPEDDIAFLDSLLPALRDERYIRVRGRAVLLVYRPALLPDPRATAERWREHARRNGVGELYLLGVQSFYHLEGTAPDIYGFDGAVEFPPHSFAVVADEQPKGFPGRPFEGNAYDYRRSAQSFLDRAPPGYKLYRAVMPRWDNTARRRAASGVFVNGGPEPYREWLARAADYTRRMYFGDERLLFVNAWNEWGEGNYLEPDRQYGHAFLDATRAVLLHP